MWLIFLFLVWSAFPCSCPRCVLMVSGGCNCVRKFIKKSIISGLTSWDLLMTRPCNHFTRLSHFAFLRIAIRWKFYDAIWFPIDSRDVNYSHIRKSPLLNPISVPVCTQTLNLDIMEVHREISPQTDRKKDIHFFLVFRSSEWKIIPFWCAIQMAFHVVVAYLHSRRSFHPFLLIFGNRLSIFRIGR